MAIVIDAVHGCLNCIIWYMAVCVCLDLCLCTFVYVHIVICNKYTL